MPPLFTAPLEGGAADGAAVQMVALLPRLLAAVLIGAALSLRPWRLLMRRPLPRAEMVHAQILLCAAAAVITVVIGDSVAKAFGLVGLGSFVRFRSGLKDPRDAAILFLVIGLGMACGHGSLELAAVGAGCVAAILLVLDLTGRSAPAEPRRLALSVAADDVAAAEQALREAFGPREVEIHRCALDFSARRVELEVEEGLPGRLGEALQAVRGVPLRDVRWSAVSPKGAKEERS